MARSIVWLVALLAGILAGTADRVGAETSAHAFAFTSIEGEALPLAAYAGRPVLVVNTASMCGYTCQYAGMQRVWSTWRAGGVVVLGVPANDFGG